MDWKFFAGLLVPAVGACFVWMTGVARKDPPLWALISRTLKWRLPVVAGAFVGGCMAAVWVKGWTGSEDVLLLVAVLVVALVQVLLALPFFDKVAALPPAPKE